MSDDITVRTGSSIAGDGHHRRPQQAKVSASAPQRRADTDGKEGKSAFGEKSLKSRMQRGGGGGGLWAAQDELQGADRGMEVPRPGAGPAGETIADGPRGNSAGHGSTDHMLIGGLVAERLILKALRSNTHVLGFLAVQISI